MKDCTVDFKKLIITLNDCKLIRESGILGKRSKYRGRNLLTKREIKKLYAYIDRMDENKSVIAKFRITQMYN